ncbi:hypothetical protein T12_8986 [Trichinella patagoniensis]|uniref:Transmembrane protein n=1 Tax=Trichinella patagoniensis TaxID=990121 RepID=A0A0V0YVC4_9BILA|nr:hypothetical protein T12_8986 [Trichinella patagoniensis]
MLRSPGATRRISNIGSPRPWLFRKPMHNKNRNNKRLLATIMRGVVDFRTNFHGLILLVVELAISLDLQFVVLLVFLI